MTPHVQEKIASATQEYQNLRLDRAYPLFIEIFENISNEEMVREVEVVSIFVRTLYELGKDEDLEKLRNRLDSIPKLKNQPALLYQLGLSLLTQNSPNVKKAKQLFETAVSTSSEPNLLARNKMGLATCLDILFGDHQTYSPIIFSIDEKKIDSYLSDLVGVWKGKILRDSGQLEEAERYLGALIARMKAEFNWHAYLSAKIILGGVYLRQKRYDRLLSVIKEVRAYCDKFPLRTIRRQMDHLADQIKGQEKRPALTWKKSGKIKTLKYQDKVLSMRGDQPWQRLLISLISQKMLPKKEIIRKLYKRNYRSKADDKLIYGQLHLIKKHLLKLGLSQKSVIKDSSGYRWNEEVFEWEEP